AGSVRSARYRRDLAARLAGLKVHQPETGDAPPDPALEQRAAELDRKASRHPCHGCPDRPEHERWAARASKLEREVGGLERRIRTRTEALGRQFDRVLAVLAELGYVRGFSLTPKGEQLRRIYADGDILVAEALSRGLFEGLSSSELAALVSTFVYESRERTPRRVSLPTGALRDRFRSLSELWGEVRRIEASHQVELCRELDLGFVPPVFDWDVGTTIQEGIYASGTSGG